MASTGVPPRPADSEGTTWVFNPPPGWPAPPAGWQPPPGWRPDPSWQAAPEDWEFWQLTTHGGQRGGSLHSKAGELHITFDGRPYRFQPGQPVRIGRGHDNDVVLGDLTVSRQHAQLNWGPDGWFFENLGQARTYLRGEPITRVAVSQVTDLALGFPQGPVLRIEPASAPGPQAAQRAADPQPTPVAEGFFREGGTARGSPPAAPPRDELMAAFQILVPVKSWLKDPGWRQGLRLLVITYALLPPVFIALFASSGNLTTPGWAYSLYIAPLWAIGFWLLIRPGPIRALEVQIGVGIIIWTLVWLNVVTANINDHLATPAQPLSFLAAIGVGFNEEITKALPVLLAGLILLKFRSAKLDVRMWMFLGTISGLTFGVSEAALYTSQAIVNVNQAQAASQAVSAVLSFAERVFVDGFQHAVWAGISAFFIGMAVNYPRRRVQLVLFGVSIPAVLHALNDWSPAAFNSYWVWIIVQAVSLLLFLGYTMSADAIERQVRRTPMFRGDSMIMDTFSESKEAGTS